MCGWNKGKEDEWKGKVVFVYGWKRIVQWKEGLGQSQMVLQEKGRHKEQRWFVGQVMCKEGKLLRQWVEKWEGTWVVVLLNDAWWLWYAQDSDYQEIMARLAQGHTQDPYSLKERFLLHGN